jgi:hypothetical protein
LASADEPQTRFSRKIFLLQKFRFGVRATRLEADFLMPRDIDRRESVGDSNNGKCFSASVSCFSAKKTSIALVGFLRQDALASASLRWSRVARTRREPSILP